MTCIFSTTVSMNASGLPFNSNEKVLCKGKCTNGKPCRNRVSQPTFTTPQSSRSQNPMLQFLTPQASNRCINRRSSYSIERMEYPTDDERNLYCYQHWWQAEVSESEVNQTAIVRDSFINHRPRSKFVHGLVSPISIESDEGEESDTETVDLTLSTKNPFTIPNAGSVDSPASSRMDPVLQDSPMSLPTIEFALLTCNDREGSPCSKTTVIEQSSPIRHVVFHRHTEPPPPSTTTSPIHPALDCMKRTKKKLLNLVEMVHPVSEAHVVAAAINVVDILENIELIAKKTSTDTLEADRSKADIETNGQIARKQTTDVISSDEDPCGILGSALQFSPSEENPPTAHVPSVMPDSDCNDSGFVRDIVLEIVKNIASNSEVDTFQRKNTPHSGQQSNTLNSRTENFISKSPILPSTWEPRQVREIDAKERGPDPDESFENPTSPARVIVSSSTADHSLDDALGDLMRKLSVTEDRASPCEEERSNNKYQCCGYSISTGKRCRRSGVRLGSRSSEAIFCHQHKKVVEKELSSTIVSKYGRNGTLCAKFEPKFWLGPGLSQATSYLLVKELREPISNSDSPGFIYGFEVENAIGYVPETHALFKVGRTRDLSRRLAQWTKQCGYRLNLKYPDTDRTASFNGGYCKFATRAEKLIHLELADRHKVDRKVCNGCRSVHNEWFCAQKGSGDGQKEIDEAWRTIEPTVIKWVYFIKVVYG